MLCRINGIYELLKQQSALIKAMDPARGREETVTYREYTREY